MQQPPEQASQPEPINPQTNLERPDLVPPVQGVRRAGEAELVPPAQSVQPREPNVPPRPVQPNAPQPNAPQPNAPQPNAPQPNAPQPNAPNAAVRQREPSGNVAPLQPEQPYSQQPALDRLPPQMQRDGAANAGATAGKVPPAQPVAAPGSGAIPANTAGAVREGQTHDETASRFVTLASLMHLPVVDLGTGRRLGRVDNIILSADHRTVEAYSSHGGFLSGTRAFPARGATIGQDAIVLPPGALERFDKRSLRGLPLAGPVTGTRLLSDTGRVLGTVTDIRMDPATAEVVGYEVNPEDRSLLDRLRHRAAVLPVAAVQRRGSDAWIVAEDDARRHLGG